MTDEMGATENTPAAIPSEWALVPREMTTDMMGAYHHAKRVFTTLPEIWSHVLAASPPATSQSEREAATFQSRVLPWMLECFGPVIPYDKIERGDRLIEEVLELLQSGDYPKERAYALIEYVYGRDKGDPSQEVGGVMVTLAAYCLAHDLDMAAAGETELARIWTKVEKIRAKQAAKPTGSALPIAALATVPAREAVEVKALEWDDSNEATSAAGHYRVQRLDDKWEPLHNGYYMLPRQHGVVSAFGTIEEAKAFVQDHHDQRILSALSRTTSEVSIIPWFERAHPDLFWHIAKGRLTPDEPLYGAIILRGDTEIGQGESDESAAAAFEIALWSAGIDASALAPVPAREAVEVKALAVSYCKITLEELQEAFGPSMPIDAAIILESAVSAYDARQKLNALISRTTEAEG